MRSNRESPHRAVEAPLQLSQRRQQRPELVAETLGTAEAAAIERLADLVHAGAAHRAARPVETETGVIPAEAGELDEPARFTGEIGNHAFILDLDEAVGRQHLPPMRHQPLVAAVVAPELGEVCTCAIF